MAVLVASALNLAHPMVQLIHLTWMASTQFLCIHCYPHYRYQLNLLLPHPFFISKPLTRLSEIYFSLQNLNWKGKCASYVNPI